MYHSRMLQNAKKISNLNEFVYLAKEISRMLKEEASILKGVTLFQVLCSV